MNLQITLPTEFEDLDAYLDMADDALLLVDDGHRILSMNRGFAGLTGFGLADIKNKPVETVIGWHPELPLPAVAQQVSDNVKRTGELPQTSVRTQSGTPVQAAYNLYEARDGDSRYYLIILYEAGLRSRRNLLQRFAGTFLKDVNLGVILITNDFRLADVSDMACRILGLDRKAVLGQPIESVFVGVPEPYRLVQRTILDGVVIRNHAMSWTNGSERYELLMDANIMKDPQEKIVGAYVIFKDVTNLRSLEAQVQRSDRLAMIGQIAAGTAHEIRNPLTSIKGFMQILRSRLQTLHLDREHQYTEIMLKEIDRINDLVSEFLLLSKPRIVNYERMDISKMLNEILPIIASEAMLHDVTVQYLPAHCLPKVVGDRELLKQVCLNICKNGIEAMTDGGELTISERLDPDERRVNIDVHDNGPGIPSFLIDKIFDPFFTTKENGTGLGLSVCQRIIHDLGGIIRVASKGFGTTFTISIPYQEG